MFRFVFLFVVLAKCSIGQSQEFSPYPAVITHDQTPVHSGPARVHYATDYLRAGETIEVWRHDPGGWCAIRPPDTSFSWVVKKHVTITDDPNVGRLERDDINAWVGSTDDSISEYLWQVRLRRGELVEILGTRDGVAADGSDEDWYRIAPPAGEFRWIQARYFQRAQSSGNATAKPTAWTTANRNAADSQVTQFQVDAAQEDMATAPDGDEELVRLNIELSQILARELRLWELTALREKAVAALGRSASDLDRGNARLLIEKIDSFDALKKKMELGSDAAPAEQELPSSAASDVTITQSAPDAAVDLESNGITPRYDGEGWLVPVVPFDREAPAYAIVDADGKIQQYLSPAPGLNLHRYLRREIGVYGRRGYIPSADVQHITAHRVVVLDRHRR